MKSSSKNRITSLKGLKEFILEKPLLRPSGLVERGWCTMV